MCILQNEKHNIFMVDLQIKFSGLIDKLQSVASEPNHALKSKARIILENFAPAVLAVSDPNTISMLHEANHHNIGGLIESLFSGLPQNVVAQSEFYEPILQDRFVEACVSEFKAFLGVVRSSPKVSQDKFLLFNCTVLGDQFIAEIRGEKKAVSQVRFLGTLFSKAFLQ